MTANAEGLPLTDLTLPAGGIGTVRALLGRHAEHTAEVLLRLPPPSEGSLRARLEFVQQATRRALEADPDLLHSLLRIVTVSGAIHVAASASRERGSKDLYAQRLRTLLPSLALELACARLLPEEGLDWPWPTGPIPWPAAGLVLEAPRGVRFLSGRLEVQGELVELDPRSLLGSPYVRARRAYLPVGGTMLLAAFDANPLLAIPGHPEGRLKIGLGGKPASEWIESLERALSLVKLGLPLLHQEMCELMQHWVPVGYDPEQHRSLSTQAAVGTVYLSLHPRPLVLMEAMVHEYQHNKLNALLNLDPLLEDGFGSLHHSPVRPDPRPLHGILLAAHALVPVVELLLRLRAQGVTDAQHASVDARIRKLVEGNSEAVETLSRHARFTPAGTKVMTQIESLAREHADTILAA